MRLKRPYFELCGIILAALFFCLGEIAIRAQNSIEAGDLIVANYSGAGGAVTRLNPLTGVASLLGTFNLPTALVMSLDGYVYVAEADGLVWRLNLTNGVITEVNSSVPLSELWGIAAAANGDLYLTSGATNRIIRLNPTNGAAAVVSTGGNLQLPIGIAVLDASNLVVSSQINSRVLKIAMSNGAQTSIATPANSINQPWGIAVSGGDIYVGAHDSRQLQRISGTNLTVVAVADLAPLGMAVGTNGDIYAGIADMLAGIYDIQRFASDGTPIGYYSGPLIGEVTGLGIAPRTVVAAPQTNSPPELGAMEDFVVGEGEVVAFTATAFDTNWPIQTVQFSLDPGFPSGALISTNGDFTWIPSEAHGPGLYTITVRATDSGSPAASATRSFTVNVAEVNTKPVLAAITNRAASVGNTLSFQATATDADLPANTLTFSLLAGAPTNAAITSGGLFAWTPVSSQAPSTNVIKVRVADNGVPSLAATQSFTVTVRTQAQISVTAMSTNKLYGATNPTFGGVLTGVPSGDNITATYSSIATSTNGVGGYPIVPVLNDPLGRLGNYIVHSTNGVLTITPAGTSGVLSSSANPALPGSNITFTCTLTIVPAGAGVLDGAVQFTLNGTNAGSPVPVTNASSSYTRSLPVGSYAVAAQYLGSSNLTASSLSLPGSQLVNTPPVAGSDTIDRWPASGTKVAVAALLANDADADGDPVSFVSFAPTSVQGGALSLYEGWIVYTPLPGFTNADSFSYTIADGRGAPVNGTVLINVRSTPAISAYLAVTVLGNGDYRIHLDAIPDHPYRLQYSVDLQNPAWIDLMSGSTDTNGSMEFVDHAAGQSRFYRSAYP